MRGAWRSRLSLGVGALLMVLETGALYAAPLPADWFLWAGVSSVCRQAVGLSPERLKKEAKLLDVLTLEQVARDPRALAWIEAIEDAEGSECTQEEAVGLGELVRRFRERQARGILKKFKPQLEAIARVRPPTRELELLRQLRKNAEIADGDFYPKGFKKTIRTRGAAAAKARKAQCETVTPQAIAPDQEMDRARRQSRGWCFAYSTADLLSVKLGTQVSGAALAASYYRDSPVFAHARGPGEVVRNLGESLLDQFRSSSLTKEGGFLTRVFATALDQGFVCTERSVPSEIRAETVRRETGEDPVSGELEYRYDEALTALEQAHAALVDELADHPVYGYPMETIGMPSLSPELMNDRSEVRRLRSQFFCEGSPLREAMTTLFPRATFEDFLKIALEVPRAEVFEELARRGCEAVRVPKDRFKIGFQENNDLTESAGMSLVRAIDRQLDQSNPVVIAYSSQGLLDPGYSRRAFSRMDPRGNAPTFDHASVVLGRTWSDLEQSCLYQIKNSWGEDCSLYSEAVTCSKGVVWVKEDHLRDLVSEVAWLEEKSAPKKASP